MHLYLADHQNSIMCVTVVRHRTDDAMCMVKPKHMTQSFSGSQTAGKVIWYCDLKL